MITSCKNLRRYCTNFQDIENYEEAVKSPERYDLHHRKEIENLEDGTVVLRSRKELKDLNLYYHRPAEELIFLRLLEHLKLNNSTNNPMYGKKHSAETIAKMSIAKKGKKLTPEARAKISAANRVREVSTETRAKMSAARSGEKNPRWKGDLASNKQNKED